MLYEKVRYENMTFVDVTVTCWERKEYKEGAIIL